MEVIELRTIPHSYEVMPLYSDKNYADIFQIVTGLQVTNESGQATFYTIYPGWYMGRATHIHIKVHINGTYVDANGVYTGGHVSHTGKMITSAIRIAISKHIGQLFFDDVFTDQVARYPPYTSHNVTRVLNHVDGIFNGEGGNSSLLSVSFINEALGFSGGVVASITLGINSSSIPRPIGGGEGPSTSTRSSHGNPNTLINSILILFHFVLFLLC